MIDDINHLGASCPEDLDLLQQAAKAWANDDIIWVVFVSSDGAAPPRMRGLYLHKYQLHMQKYHQ
jgi:hypothetical protein